MTPLHPVVPYLAVAGLLFCIGFAGAVARRNVILMLVGVELMLNAANLSFVAFWRHGPQPDPSTGILFALFSIAVAAAEASVGLALVIALFRHRRSTDPAAVTALRG